MARRGIFPVALALLALASCLLLVAGAAASPPSPDALNLLQNPSFEQGLAPWSPSSGLSVSITTTRHLGGAASAMLATDGHINHRLSLWQTVAVTPHAAYQASGYFFPSETNYYAPDVRIVWLDAAGQPLQEEWWAVAGTLVQGWQQWTISAVAPGDAVQATISATLYVLSYLYPAVFLDDMAFAMQSPPPSPATASATRPATHTPSTATPAASATATPSPWPTASATLTATATPTASATPSPSPTATPSATAPAGSLLINEFQYNPPHQGSEWPYEWLEVYNTTGVTMALHAWTIGDSEASDTLPDIAVPPSGFAVIAGQHSAFMENFPSFAGQIAAIGAPIGNGMANSGGRLLLRDGAGRLIDAVSYDADTGVFNPSCPSVAIGHSLERRPAGAAGGQAGDFQDQPNPSPGEGWAAPSATPTPTASATSTATPEHTATATQVVIDTSTPSATATPRPTAARLCFPLIVFTPTHTPTATATATPTCTAEPRFVALNEFLPSPRLIDWNADDRLNSSDEWIELHNTAAQPVDIGGWALDDEPDEGSSFYFIPAGTIIPPHGFLIFFGSETGINLADRDAVRLLHRTGAVLEEYRYFDTWPDRSFSKASDGGRELDHLVSALARHPQRALAFWFTQHRHITQEHPDNHQRHGAQRRRQRQGILHADDRHHNAGRQDRGDEHGHIDRRRIESDVTRPALFRADVEQAIEQPIVERRQCQSPSPSGMSKNSGKGAKAVIMGIGVMPA